MIILEILALAVIFGGVCWLFSCTGPIKIIIWLSILGGIFIGVGFLVGIGFKLATGG
jgi:hypothetical protein